MVKVYLTARAERDLQAIYEYTLATFGKKTTLDIKRQIEDVIKRLKQDSQAWGKLDSEHYSGRFKFVTIKNSQKIFFEKYGKDVVIVMVGHVARDWKTILQEMEPYIDKQLAKLAEKKT